MADRTILMQENGRLTMRGLFMLNGYPTAFHDDDDKLTYTVDWSRWLGANTISAVTNTADDMTITGESNTTTTATFTVELDDGASGELEQQITDSGGQKKTLRIRYRSRRDDEQEDYRI